MKTLCIYHGGCDDGFAAAWMIRFALGKENVEFYPGIYQQEPPDVTDRDVIMVDFSYKKPILLQMAAKARSIFVLDHHKTAEEDLKDFVLPLEYREWGIHEHDKAYLAPEERILAYFDMTRSGAGLAWDYFMNGLKRPPFVNYIEDRDLWKKTLWGGDEFTIALRSYPQDFEVWDGLVDDVQRLIKEGEAIQRYYRRRVDELKKSAYPSSIGGVSCMIANAPYFAASEVAGEIALSPDIITMFGACYFEVSRGRWQYSLRSSRENGDFDVSTIAKHFGGGGHRNAAGFTADRPVHESL